MAAMWYGTAKVSRTAENMMNIEKMRKMAFYYKNQYFTTSIMLCMLIAVIALICMLVGIWFVGIPAIYCIQLCDYNVHRWKPCFVSADAVYRTAKPNYRRIMISDYKI